MFDNKNRGQIKTKFDLLRAKTKLVTLKKCFVKLSKRFASNE